MPDEPGAARKYYVSGTGRWWGLCPDCKGDVNRNETDWIGGEARYFSPDLYEPVRGLLQVYDNLPIMPKCDSQMAYMAPVDPIRFIRAIENIRNQ